MNFYFGIMILRKTNFGIIRYSVIFTATLYSSDFLNFVYKNVVIVVLLAPRRSLRQRAPVRYNLEDQLVGPLARLPKKDGEEDDDFTAESEVYYLN